jgi:uncharacterized protein
METEQTSFNLARASLQQAISWYSRFQRHGKHTPNLELQVAVKKDLQILKSALDKLDQNIIKIATFGLVSKGKSAVINALVGQKILETGPINGVTKYPRAVRWNPPSGKIQIELIDTPGLDEIEGENRTKMAQEVASQVDLILFVIAGDITRTEYEALWELQKNHKPLIVVFNKIDLYPDRDIQTIYNHLHKSNFSKNNQTFPLHISNQEIARISAEPQPIPMRVEWEDGRITQEWENPPPNVRELQEMLLNILNREGRSLLALNALLQGKKAQENIAQTTIKLRQEEAEELIWRYAKYKALVVAINPIAILDLVGGLFADLNLIRSLAKLYGLPITSYEAGKLWKKILISSGSLLIGELLGGLALGIMKSATGMMGMFENPTALTTYGGTVITQAGIEKCGMMGMFENPTALTTYGGTVITQAGIAGYGAYIGENNPRILRKRLHLGRFRGECSN